MDNDHILEVIRRHTTFVVPDIDPATIGAETVLADLGCNSIDRAEIVTLAMEDLGIIVPVPEFQSATNVGTLVALLRRHT